MSTAFYLPIALSPAPARWVTAAIVALHCLPLAPLAAVVDGALAWPLGAAAGLSLVFHLHRQRPAAATRLEATAAGEWLLHRGAGRRDKVTLVDQVNCGWCVLLLVEEQRRRFRLLVRCRDQDREQLHRLRVLRAQWRAGRPRTFRGTGE